MTPCMQNKIYGKGGQNMHWPYRQLHPKEGKHLLSESKKLV